jgi:hypothetical protein
MGRFLQVIVSLPTVVFTVLVGASLLYWLSVVLGALDVEILGGADGADGGADGADGGHDGGHDGADIDGGEAGGAHHGLFTAIGGPDLRKVPVTVRISFVSIFAWLVSTVGVVSLGGPVARAGVPAIVFDLGLTLVALVVGFRLAGFAARPLAPVFAGTNAQQKKHLVGKLAEVCTGRVDERFGQVMVHDGGAGLILDARHEGPPLKRGDRVVITGYDDDKSVVSVEPIDATHVRATPAGAPATSQEAPADAPPTAGQKRRAPTDSR